MVKVDFMDAFNKLKEYLESTVKDVFEWFKKDLLDPIVNAFNAIVQAIKDVIEWLGNLIDALKDFVWPSPITPGSPTPAEKGLLGILDALRQVSREIAVTDWSGLVDSSFLGGLVAGAEDIVRTVGLVIDSLVELGKAGASLSFSTWLDTDVFDSFESGLRGISSTIQQMNEDLIQFNLTASRTPNLSLSGVGSAAGVPLASSLAQASIQQTFGDLVFSNVRDGRDALGVRRAITRDALEASMVGRLYRQGV